MTPMRHVRYSKEYPVRFVSLEVLLPNAKLLVLVAALTEECKKWHPEIPDVEIALPHFIQWFRRNTTE
jgi:hypothetical protein